MGAVIRRLLIANRGEIALRIIRACRERGIESVAIYSAADEGAIHVRAADRAVPVGPARAAESYLSIPNVVEAAVRSGADAVHPGYGFLAENAAFAAACRDAGLVFVGPPAEVLARVGSKTEARRVAHSAGVPIVPGIAPSDQSLPALREAARQLGLPLVIKASAGGGGRGMRTVRTLQDLDSAIESARREAESAFGDGTLYLERLVERSRHVEIQILADHHGHVVHLFERDCTVQRRHQKVIEESPSPVVTPRLRSALGDAAVAIARAAGYRNAGTIEFLLEPAETAPDGFSFYFLEVNARLQVEHPVTEVVTGVDIVGAQLLIAAGHELPWTQSQLEQRGHAIECRIYAEDPASQFAPQAGTISSYRAPALEGVRIDAGITAGSRVPLFYDPLLAKVVAAGETRMQAVERARAAVQQFRIGGIRTNLDLLGQILAHPRFTAGDVDTSFLESALESMLLMRHPASGGPPRAQAWDDASAPSSWPGSTPGPGWDPWVVLTGWRIDEPAVARAPGRGREQPDAAGSDHASRRPPDEPLTAVMPATVVQVFVQPGQIVRAGDPLVTLEAMKMEMPITAPHDGTVASVRCQVGDLVQPGAVLVELTS